MTVEDSQQKVSTRKTRFIEDWESRNIWIWNLAEYEAYKSLKSKQTIDN